MPEPRKRPAKKPATSATPVAAPEPAVPPDRGPGPDDAVTIVAVQDEPAHEAEESD